MDKNKQGKERRRFFAVTSLGRKRWYWVVWPSLEDIQASTEPLLHVGEGYAATKTEATRKAMQVAGEHTEKIAAKYARQFHRNKVSVTRKRAQSRLADGSHTPFPQGFLYRDEYDLESKEWLSTSHRVVRRTGKYVYVEQRPYAAVDARGIWLDQEHSVIRLERQALEHVGYARVPETVQEADTKEPVFFDYERMKTYEQQLFESMEVLNISYPYTQAQVGAAYRKLVQHAHPEGGGDQDKYLALQGAYQQALQLYD